MVLMDVSIFAVCVGFFNFVQYNANDPFETTLNENIVTYIVLTGFVCQQFHVRVIRL